MRGQGDSKLQSLQPQSAQSLLPRWEMSGVLEGKVRALHLPLHHQTHLVPTPVPSSALPGQGSCVLGSSCCSTAGLGSASRGAKGTVRCRESSAVSQSSPQAALRSQEPAQQPLGDGKPKPPTKCRSMMDVQSPTALGSTALGHRVLASLGWMGEMGWRGDIRGSGSAWGKGRKAWGFGKRTLMLETGIGDGKAGPQEGK